MAELTIPAETKPTLFNKDMVIGALAGNLIGALAGSMLAGPAGGLMGKLAGGWIGRAIGIAVGGMVGGAYGEHVQQQEAASGKPVRSPSFLNKDTLLGGLLGITGGGLLAGLALKVALVTATLTGPAALAIAVTGLIGGTIAGTWLGAKHGQETMTHDYDQALRAQAQGITRGQDRAQTIEMDGPVSDYSAQIKAERLLAAAQQNHR